MHSSPAFLSLLICSFLLGTAFSEEKEAAQPLTPKETQIRKDIKAMLVAGTRGDGKTYVQYIHPKMFERQAGLKEKTIKQIEKAQEAIEKVEKLLGEPFEIEPKFTKRATFLQTAKHEFAIVPVEIVTDSGFATVEVGNFILGIREGEQTEWKYMDGSKLDQRAIHDYFSDFPIDQPLPQVETKTKPKEGGFDDFMDRVDSPSFGSDL
ncbi:hypothetical protein [Blastopirellula marina]|uniref:Uncharacterized protein n=1 Tax=Blastopirellula marina TaxID=124 RepID=A0A2S8G253_9BACT|nr:hypothetical protein [Blastopirellula marina]PQO38214.1 hypothetical protein C5Y98_09085 [Blastopirellula marina]PTL44870.1 hypothetical protein C5Y97_09090 [Blastopirellula marina]